MEVKITCVILDDEPLGQELLKKYVSRLDYLELAAVYENAIEALGKMTTLRPDIIFLDVNMPEMNGIEFMNTFSSNYKPYVIMTTAYSEYAVQGFEYDVADFLLKPVTFDRFVKAINKVQEKMRFKNPVSASINLPVAADPEKQFLLVKENKKFMNIALEDIICVEGMKDYLRIHTLGKSVVTHMTMTKIEELLTRDFLRVNRSYIVRKSAIKAIHGNTIELNNNTEIPVGTRYRDSIREIMESGTL